LNTRPAASLAFGPFDEALSFEDALVEHHHHLHLLLYIPVKHQRKKLRIWTLHVREQPLLTQFLHHYTAKKLVQDSVTLL
jgi:hypothetical protein